MPRTSPDLLRHAVHLRAGRHALLGSGKAASLHARSPGGVVRARSQSIQQLGMFATRRVAIDLKLRHRQVYSKWVCASMNPGTTTRPPSNTRAVRLRPDLAILSQRHDATAPHRAADHLRRSAGGEDRSLINARSARRRRPHRSSTRSCASGRGEDAPASTAAASEIAAVHCGFFRSQSAHLPRDGHVDAGIGVRAGGGVRVGDGDAAERPATDHARAISGVPAPSTGSK